MTQPGLSNDLEITQRAIEHFNTAEQNALRIRAQVDDSIMLLTGRAMVSLSGTQFGAAMAEWSAQFQRIVSALNLFEQNTQLTVHGLQQNESNNTEITGQILNELGTVNY